ncbi:MAG: sigma-54-dependent Fis family transcriptional regulator [Deltaproteobacteria bacterium]|nr:sigma-54-dependent Fis family transcriptional regulator [Deltaproteobacteria bacterium]
MNQAASGRFIVGVLGSADFCRRVQALIAGFDTSVEVVHGNLSEGWSLVVTHRPQCLILEIGLYHGEKLHTALRKFLQQLRERSGDEVFVTAALMAPEKLSYGGDLLFAEPATLKPSGFIDSFIALAPGSMPSVPGLTEQLQNLISLVRLEFARRAEGKKPLPCLGTAGWVQSLADPQSRELWMRWLPRYATYTNENPIIIGRTGTGKTNLALALHILSGRSGQFVSITPRDFSSSELVQAELFGAVAGAYTGAVDKWGLVKKAEKGTLFIDELQSIDKELQGKLITFIENKFYRRVGSAETVEADVRFVFASNMTLSEMMATNVLRHDFAYRLERVQLELADLQTRRLDITAALAYALAKVYRQRPHAVHIEGVTSGAYRQLFGHSWPGNLRQLENNVAQLCEMTDMRATKIIDEQVVLDVFKSRISGAAATAPEIIAEAAVGFANRALRESVTSLDDSVTKFVESVRLTALEAKGGDVQRASEAIQDSSAALTLFVQGREIKNTTAKR